MELEGLRGFEGLRVFGGGLRELGGLRGLEGGLKVLEGGLGLRALLERGLKALLAGFEPEVSALRGFWKKDAGLLEFWKKLMAARDNALCVLV